MQYLRWFVLALASTVLSLVAVVLSPVLPLFAIGRDTLPRWLSWFQTPDNSIDGDYGFRFEHAQWRYRLPAPLARYVGRVLWLIRNPAYGFDWFIAAASVSPSDGLTFTGNPNTRDKPEGVEGRLFVQVGEYWNFIYIRRFGAKRCVFINLGWDLRGFAEANSAPRTMTLHPLNASIRFTTFAA